MYFPPTVLSKKTFWGVVHIAFIIAALMLWADEHEKVLQLKSKPIPNLAISLDGKPLDWQVVSITGGSFNLEPFVLESDGGIPSISMTALTSRDANIQGDFEDIWKKGGKAEPGFPFAWTWDSNRPLAAGQAWPGPSLWGSLWSPPPDPESGKPLNVRLKIYYGAPAPKTVNFVIQQQ
jgi:hypothetical protein